MERDQERSENREVCEYVMGEGQRGRRRLIEKEKREREREGENKIRERESR